MQVCICRLGFMGTEGTIMASLIIPDPIERLVVPTIAYEAVAIDFLI